MRAYELSRGYFRPLDATPIPLPLVPFDAHGTLNIKSRLFKIFFSKPIRDIPLSDGDLIDVYVKQYDQRRNKWSSPQSILSLDRATWTVSTPVFHDRTINATVEDVQPSIDGDSLASFVRI